MHCHAAGEQWAVVLLHCTTTLLEQWLVVLLQSTTTLLGSSWERYSFSALHFAGEQWAVVLLQCIAAVLGSNGQWYSGSALPQFWGAMGSGSPAVHCHTAWKSG